MISAAVITVRRWATQARTAQLDALCNMLVLDQAVQQSADQPAAAHATTATSTEILRAQLEAPAAEDAHPPATYASGMAENADSATWWVAAVALLCVFCALGLLA